jgi:hypothetical protein
MGQLVNVASSTICSIYVSTYYMGEAGSALFFEKMFNHVFHKEEAKYKVKLQTEAK